MAVPKRKTSKSRNKMRQAGKGLIKKNTISVDKDGNLKLSHNTIIRKEKKKGNNDKEEQK